MQYIPVIDSNQHPLMPIMPTTPNKSKTLDKNGQGNAIFSERYLPYSKSRRWDTWTLQVNFVGLNVPEINI
jgi:hypothetical protein